MTVELLLRAEGALYICAGCGATILGSEIPCGRRCFVALARGGLPTFPCPRCNVAILEPIETR